MKELPRSRALVRLDGPGHIMPVEPITPPDSTVWGVIHFPVMLAALAIALLFAARSAIGLVGDGVQSLGHVPGIRYLVPLVAAAALTAAYLLFVRSVERRPAVEELGTDGAAAEFSLGYAGGLVLSFVPFAIMWLLGGLDIVGINRPGTLVQPFVLQLCTAFIVEVIACGLAFRLIERWLGSWLTLLLAMAFFGAFRFLGAADQPLAVLAVVMEAGLLFGAAYMLTRRLWAAIGLNAGWKFAQLSLFGALLDSDGPGGLLRLYANGPAWLTGGGAGPAASLPALAAGSLALVVLLAMAIRRGRIVRPAWRRGRTARVARDAT